MANCKEKLTYFRIKELKDILTQLQLSKQGKKQDLVDRILAVLSDERGTWAKKNAIGKEGVAKLVDDTYRKMQVSGSAELASKSQAVSDSTNVKLKEEAEDSYQMEKIRCLCVSTLPTDSMIKCEDPRCNIWQHMACVLISEKSMEGVLPNPPDTFYCEICRLNRADPFWVTISHPLYPVKLNITNVPTDGSNPSLSIEKTFQLTRSDRDLLSKQEYDLQAWCMLLSDKVTFRMQWPQYADLQINGVPVRAINRPGSQLLGVNGRDDGPIITPCTKDGINKIFVGGCDSRIFCVGVRIVKRRTLQQVLNIIPGEGEGECFEDALARVRRCAGRGDVEENADSDSDIEVVADFISVNLRCPMSGLRMKVAGRFKPCLHIGCFDLRVFVEMNQRSRKWQCPVCLKNYSLEKIVIDPYFNRIISKMQNCGEDVAEIEVKPDGSWRAKAEGDRRGLGDIGLWHSPDGSICAPADTELKPKLEPKQEVGSDSHMGGLKLGMRKNQNGCWEINKPNDVQGILSSNKFEENFEHNIIPMSSSDTASGRDCEDASVNQDGGGTLDFSTINAFEYDSIPTNLDRTTPAPEAEVIVLSDSDEETVPLMPSSSNLKPDNGAAQFPPAPHGIPDSFYENPSLGLYGGNDDDFGNMWSMPSTSQGGQAGFQLFSSDIDVSEALVEMQQQQQGPINCTSSLNGYTLTGETAMGSTALVPECTAQLSNDNEGLVDNPLAFSGNDPSLQIFLPTRPSEAASVGPSDLREQQDVSNGMQEDWISLRLGVDSLGGNGPSAGQMQSRDANADLSAENASLLLGMNDNRSKLNRERSDSPFTFPRQKRSVRPRLFLSIDTDSE